MDKRLLPLLPLVAKQSLHNQEVNAQHRTGLK